MATTLDPSTRRARRGPTGAGAPRSRRGHWIDHWEPDDEVFWESTGRAIARRNLVLSMFTDHVGFCIWVIWTIVVLDLADVGIRLPISDLFALTLTPNLIGAMLRCPTPSRSPGSGGARGPPPAERSC